MKKKMDKIKLKFIRKKSNIYVSILMNFYYKRGLRRYPFISSIIWFSDRWIMDEEIDIEKEIIKWHSLIFVLLSYLYHTCGKKKKDLCGS